MPLNADRRSTGLSVPQNVTIIFPTRRQVPKTEFEEKKNDVLEREPFVTCSDCERKHHQVCVLHHPNIWKKG